MEKSLIEDGTKNTNLVCDVIDAENTRNTVVHATCQCTEAVEGRGKKKSEKKSEKKAKGNGEKRELNEGETNFSCPAVSV